MKCPYARLKKDRYGNKYVVCDKYNTTFDDAYHINTYCMGGKRCDKGIFGL